MGKYGKLIILAFFCAVVLFVPSFASALLVTASGTGTGGATLSASADFSIVSHFGNPNDAIQIILTNTGPATTVRGNLLTGLFWTFSGVNSLSTAIDGQAGTVDYLIPNGPGPSDDQIGTSTNVDIAPAASGSGLYMLSNGPFGIANNNQDYSAFEYGIGTVGYGLTGFDGNAVDGDDYGIAAAGTQYLGGVKAALPLIDTTATFWIPYAGGSIPEITNYAFTYGSLPDNTIAPEPVTMLLFGSGLIGVAAVIRRRFKK